MIMADAEERILSIKVDYAEAIKAIADYRAKLDELKESEKELKEQLKAGTISQQQYNEEVAASKIKAQQYTEAVRVLNKEVNNSIKSDKGKETSLRGLRAQLSNLTAEYDNLSREERESAKGKELQEHINAITKELKGAEEETGRFYRNVGNYMGSVKGAFGIASQAVIDFGQQLKALMANPFILAIGVIATAVNGIAKAIQSSEEQTNRWRMALAPLNAIMDIVQNSLTKMAGYILDVAEGAGKLWNWVMKLAGEDTKLGKAMGEVNSQMQERARLEKMQQEYTKASRDEIVKSAERERVIADLRSKVVQKDKYSAKERIAYLDEAIKLETEQAETQKRLAQMNLDALELEASFTENDAAMNDKLAEAKAAVVRADTDLSNKTRELLTQRVEVINQINAEAKATNTLADAKMKETEARLKEIEEEIKRKAQLAEKEWQSEMDYQQRLAEARLAGTEKGTGAEHALRLQILRLQRDEELHEAEQTEEMRLAIIAKYAKLESEERQRYDDEQAARAQDLADKEVAIQQAKYQAMQTITDSLIGLTEEIGESNRAMAIASKVLALAQIAIDTGVALSSGIKASAGVPFPGNLAAIATTIATVLANITTAIKTVKSAKFATGGDVTGAGTETSDSVPAMLSNGESVLTARATSMFAPILSAFNQAGGGVPIYGQQTGNQAMGEDMLAKAFAKGVAGMPSPVVSVEEISRVENRVRVIENLNRI